MVNLSRAAQRSLWLVPPALIGIALALVWSAEAPLPLDESWSVAAAESEGMDGRRLEALDSFLAARETDAWLVVRGGKIIHEWYRDETAKGPLGAASMSKALVGGLGLMLASDSGVLSFDSKAADYVQHWYNDPLGRHVRVSQLADHTSGLAHPREPEDLPGDALRWETAFWQRNSDLIDLVETEVPFLAEPGSDYHYSGPAYAVLSHVLTRALQDSPWRDLRTLLDERIMTPLGLRPASWRIGYGNQPFDVEGLDLYATWGGAAFTARATARIGLLLLQQGRWQGQNLLSADVVRAATTFDRSVRPPTSVAEGFRPAPALGWWSNAFGALPSLPPDAFLGAGAEHRVLVVVPSLDLVLVRYGKRLGEDHWDGDFWTTLDSVFLAPIIDTLQDPQAIAVAWPPHRH